MHTGHTNSLELCRGLANSGCLPLNPVTLRSLDPEKIPGWSLKGQEDGKTLVSLLKKSDLFHFDRTFAGCHCQPVYWKYTKDKNKYLYRKDWKDTGSFAIAVLTAGPHVIDAQAFLTQLTLTDRNTRFLSRACHYNTCKSKRRNGL